MRRHLPLILVTLVSAVRPLHWAIRASSLERTLDFTQNVLGMKVLRQDGNSSWSKTTLGYGPDGQGLALQVIHNKTISKYPKGEGLQRFILEHTNVQGSIGSAKRLGYLMSEGINGSISIFGPDEYVYELRSSSSAKTVGLQSVMLRSFTNLDLVAAWYEELLGFTRAADADAADGRMALQLRNRSLQFIFETVETPLRLREWDGDNTIALPEQRLKNIYTWLSEESRLSIVHVLEEQPGYLHAVVRDPAGYHLRLVSESASGLSTSTPSPSRSGTSTMQRLEL